MSVQNCEKCGEPGLFSETLGEGNLRRIAHPHKDATFIHPNCEIKENLCPECGHLQLVHLTDYHLSVRRGWLPDCPACCHDHLCPCTRTYESLVGEKGKQVHAADGYCETGDCAPLPPESAKYEQVAEKEKASVIYARRHGLCEHCGSRGHRTSDAVCNRFDKQVPLDAKPEPSLQLLVIDCGNECYVKVEKGVMPHTSNDMMRDLGFYGQSSVVQCTFTKLREAIDGVKPLPRIDPCQTGGLYRLKTNVPDDDTFLSQTSIDALSEIAGVQLPIWSGGTWERLNTHDWTQAKKDASEAGYGISTFSFEEVVCPVKIWRYKR